MAIAKHTRAIARLNSEIVGHEEALAMLYDEEANEFEEERYLMDVNENSQCKQIDFSPYEKCKVYSSRKCLRDSTDL